MSQDREGGRAGSVRYPVAQAYDPCRGPAPGARRPAAQVQTEYSGRGCVRICGESKMPDLQLKYWLARTERQKQENQFVESSSNRKSNLPWRNNTTLLLRLRMRRLAYFLVALLAPFCSALAQGQDASGSSQTELEFESMFDGETLNNWSPSTPQAKGDWFVREGIIVGVGGKHRSYLIYNKNRDVSDFEMKFSYRFPGEGNSGVNIRASEDETGKRDYKAYHVELGHVGIGRQVLGAWDFHTPGRKEHRCFRGERLVIGENDEPTLTSIPGAVTSENIHKHQWNQVHISVVDNKYKFSINGKPAAEFTEHLPADRRLKSGMIQLQLHDPGMKVHFKDLFVKILD